MARGKSSGDSGDKTPRKRGKVEGFPVGNQDDSKRGRGTPGKGGQERGGRYDKKDGK
jgi:hypothetical protein